MKKLRYPCILIILACLFTYCEKNKDTCIEGLVIGREISNENCGTGTLIQITSDIKLGKEIIYEKNNTQYSNVIKAPGAFPDGKIYFEYRAFDDSKDIDLYPYVPCQAFYVVYDVPILVITDYSQQKCPLDEN